METFRSYEEMENFLIDMFDDYIIRETSSIPGCQSFDVYAPDFKFTVFVENEKRNWRNNMRQHYRRR